MDAAICQETVAVPLSDKVSPPYTEKWRITLRTIPTFSLPVIIIGGIYGGFFTPIVAAAFAVLAAVLIGLIAGYAVAWLLGMVSFAAVERAPVMALPNLFHFGFEFSLAAIIGFALMAIISAIETVGDVSGICKGGAGRQATDKEIEGATFADGIGSAIAGFFGALPNTSFSQNVGLIAMTGVMSRHVVTIGGLFLVLCGLVPKIGAVISTVPIQVLGGGVIVMFGMVVAAGVSMLSDVHWNRRNMVIFAVALSIGLGLQLEPAALQHMPDTLHVLLTSGLLPAAFIAITLNLLLPEEIVQEQTEEISGGMAGHKVSAAE